MKRALLAAIAVCAALAGLELAMRAGVTFYGSEAARIRYVYSSSAIRAQQARLRGAPYLAYRLTPGYPTHNNRGYRGPEITVPKPPGVFRIVALGGSTTYGEHLARWEDAWPAQLEQILRERGHRVDVINAGVPGYSSWEMLLAFEFQLLDLQPDLLIVYEGINDLYPRLVKPSQYDGLATSKGLWRTDDRDLPASALHRFVAIGLGWIDDPVAAPSQFDRRMSAEYCDFDAAYARCTNFDQAPDAVLAANPPTYFERNVRSLIAIAQSNGVKVLLSSWAYFADPIRDVENGTFMTLPFVQRAVAEHNRILGDVAASTRVPFYDLARELPSSRAFWIEGMHQSAAGAREQAARYADFLAAQGLVP